MDLHSLHHPTNTQNSRQQSSSSRTDAVHCPAESALRSELERQKGVANQWKRELDKMEQIANQALERLERKKQDKQALKTELASWRTRYNELAQAQMQVLKTKDKDKSTYEQKLAELQEQHHEIKERLIAGGRAVRELEALRNAKAGEEGPEKLLTAARKKLQTTESELASTRKRLQVAENELAASKDKLRTSQLDLTTSKDKLRTSQLELTASKDKLRAAQLELAPTREKLRAAAKDCSHKTDKLAACVDMLMRAEQVLHTCSQLHESSHLSAALVETTQNFSKFRKSLDCGAQTAF
jgi:chromosome segregation ATPase